MVLVVIVLGGGYCHAQAPAAPFDTLPLRHSARAAPVVDPPLPDALEAGWKGKSVCEMLHEDPEQRILRCTFPPAVGHERHFHRRHFGYVLAGGRMRVTDADGVREVVLATGSDFSSEGVAWHEVLNVGESTAVFLMVEPRSPSAQGTQMTPNKRAVEAYMEGFRKTDRPQILSCLTDDVEWVLPGAFHVRGKDEFAKHIVDEGFAGQPQITVSRLIEEGDVVVAEGSVRAPKQDGTFLNLVFCDVFDMRDGKIWRLVSYLMETK